MKKILITFIYIILLPVTLPAQPEGFYLHNGWKARRAADVRLDGTEITSAMFSPEGWLDAVIPGTILGTLLHNGLIPDPFFGLNNNLIPDVYDTGRDYYTYWFFNEFEVPGLKENNEIWLNFRGINYFAEIFLNGKRVNADTHEGMYLREKYLITPFIKKEGKNKIAVLVAPPDPAGNPAAGQGGDGTIGRSVTMQCTAGWDWICPIRDRNTGIWDHVFIETTGQADIRNPFIRTRVPGVRVPAGKQEPAFVTVSAEIRNTSPRVLYGNLITEFDGNKKITKIAVDPFTQISVTVPEFRVTSPQLWWPNGYGRQPLYKVKLTLESETGIIVDSEDVTCGLRETGNYFDENIRARVFTVNGQKIFIKGGNWIASDALLRLTPGRYDTEVRYHAGMNMNMIRVWGGGLTERPEFYDACDKYGILVWQDLWVSGDCNGEWNDQTKKDSQARRKAYPDKHSLFLESAVDQIKMLRNHPSLYLWCGGNETLPPPDILEALKTSVFPGNDPDRYFLDMSTHSNLMTNTIGGVGDGPYGIREPYMMFTERSFPFNPETGSIGIPNYEGLKRIIPEEEMVPPQQNRGGRSWTYHKYLTMQDFPERYGKIKDIRDFCFKAQLVSYEQYRSLQEAFNHRMWDWYSGMLVWKNQNPWTALRGFFYDYFLECTGGYFGFMHGAAPVHIQLNLNDSTVCVLNQKPEDLNNLRATIRLFDLHGTLLSEYNHDLEIGAGKTKLLNKVILPPGGNKVFFLKLNLSDGYNVIDENLYWLSNQPHTYEYLNNLEKTSIKVAVKEKRGDRLILEAANEGDETAFFIRMKITGESGELVLPAFFSDNYFTLLPGERKLIEMEPGKNFSAKDLRLAWEGWNVPETIFRQEIN